jgi:hypothetical protein
MRYADRAVRDYTRRALAVEALYARWGRPLFWVGLALLVGWMLGVVGC